MKLRISIIFILLSIGFVQAQKMRKVDFIQKDWCTNNLDNKFYKSDTVKLYYITDSLNQTQKLNKQYRELDFNNTNDITQLKFDKNKNLEVIDVHVESWTNSHRIGKWKWKYNEKHQILQFRFENKLFFKFKIENISYDQLEWKYNDLKNQPITEIYHFTVLTLSRLK
jgi:hypothetical protein